MEGKTYDELLQDIAWEMGKIFGEKAEAVFCSYVYPEPPEGTDPVVNVHDETGIIVGDVDRVYLSLIKEAVELNQQETRKLNEAVKIMREMRRANDGK